MCNIQINVQCYDKFFEVLPTEVEDAELMVEDGVSRVLYSLFGGGAVEDVTIRFSSHVRMGLHLCSIQILAYCPCQNFTQRPRTKKNIEREVGKNMCAILRELFGSVKIESITLNPTPHVLGSDPARSCCV